jgi:hypothetical protein
MSRTSTTRPGSTGPGNFHSDALHVVERFTPINADALRYEATIEDQNVFTKPWTIAMPIYRRLEPNARCSTIPCIDFTEEFLYGISASSSW